MKRLHCRLIQDDVNRRYKLKVASLDAKSSYVSTLRRRTRMLSFYMPKTCFEFLEFLETLELKKVVLPTLLSLVAILVAANRKSIAALDLKKSRTRNKIGHATRSWPWKIKKSTPTHVSKYITRYFILFKSNKIEELSQFGTKPTSPIRKCDCQFWIYNSLPRTKSAPTTDSSL